MKWLYFVFIALLISCNTQKSKVFIPKDIVIAHRGSTYWTPEETEAAYRWARNIGADYLEVDIQRTKDGVLLALHDESLKRTTNIEQIFSDSSSFGVSAYSYEELMNLDAGIWFNLKYPERARLGFTPNLVLMQKSKNPAICFGEEQNILDTWDNQQIYIGGKQYISTLEDVIRIADGYCIARDSLGNRLYQKELVNNKPVYHFYYTKDPVDSGDRPGVYIETKQADLFPGIENDLFVLLDRFGWNNVTKPVNDTMIHQNGKIRVAKTSARIIFQTFSQKSLQQLYATFKGKIPTTLLLWQGDSNMPENDSVSYFANLNFAKKYGAQIIGPSIGGAPANYHDLLNEENYRWIKSYHFTIHPYSFDTRLQTNKYGNRCDGMFTNRAELTIDYYQKQGKREIPENKNPEQVLYELGY